eukprot:RCo036439
MARSLLLLLLLGGNDAEPLGWVHVVVVPPQQPHQVPPRGQRRVGLPTAATQRGVCLNELLQAHRGSRPTRLYEGLQAGDDGLLVEGPALLVGLVVRLPLRVAGEINPPLPRVARGQRQDVAVAADQLPPNHRTVPTAGLYHRTVGLPGAMAGQELQAVQVHAALVRVDRGVAEELRQNRHHSLLVPGDLGGWRCTDTHCCRARKIGRRATPWLRILAEWREAALRSCTHQPKGASGRARRSSGIGCCCFCFCFRGGAGGAGVAVVAAPLLFALHFSGPAAPQRGHRERRQRFRSLPVLLLYLTNDGEQARERAGVRPATSGLPAGSGRHDETVGWQSVGVPHRSPRRHVPRGGNRTGRVKHSACGEKMI